jgi:hypothetical protein
MKLLLRFQVRSKLINPSQPARFSGSWQKTFGSNAAPISRTILVNMFQQHFIFFITPRSFFNVTSFKFSFHNNNFSIFSFFFVWFMVWEIFLKWNDGLLLCGWVYGKWMELYTWRVWFDFVLVLCDVDVFYWFVVKGLCDLNTWDFCFHLHYERFWRLVGTSTTPPFFHAFQIEITNLN